MTPEQRLWQAVVFQAARDATAIRTTRGKANGAGTSSLDKSQADSFLRGGRDLHFVCSLAGLDPEFIRDAYRNGRIERSALTYDRRTDVPRVTFPPSGTSLGDAATGAASVASFSSAES